MRKFSSESGTAVLFAAVLKPFVLLYVGLLTTGATLVSFAGFSATSSGFHRFESPLAGWDAAHYLHLAFNGYVAGDPSCAFYPLWPFLLSLLYLVIPLDSAWPACALAILLAFGAYIAFINLGLAITNLRCTTITLLLYATYPGTLFLVIPYSEALFLLLLFGCFLGLERRNYWLAGTTAFFMPMARPVGIFIAPALLVYLFRKRLLKSHFGLVILPIVGFAFYLLIVKLSTGSPLTGIHAQTAYPAAASLAKLLDPIDFLYSFFTASTLHDMGRSMLDRMFFLFLLGALPFVWRLRPEWFCWCLFAGILPAITNSFISYVRYSIVVFPVFFVYAQWLAQDSTFKVLYYLAILSALQIFFAVRFFDSGWAG